MPPKLGPSESELEKKMFSAIESGDPLKLGALLKLLKFDINHKNQHGYIMMKPPIEKLKLYNFMDKGYTSVEKLKPQKADGCTPLHTAVIFGKIPIIEILLKEGADPNIENAFGLKPTELNECFSPDDIKLMPKILIHVEYLKKSISDKQ